MSSGRRSLEVFVQLLIVYSVATLFIELEVTEHGPSKGFWLWSERVVAVLFTIEYAARWIGSRSFLYPLRPMAVIDLVAVLPFYAGFFVGSSSLRMVRTLRVLRILKFHRYGDSLPSFYRAFYHIRQELGVTAIVGLVMGGCTAVAIFETEHDAQPEVFARVSDGVWYVLVTVTTVGYGDKVPVTHAGKIVGAVVMLSGLVLFGTFVSLVGSAFVEEIRRKKGKGLPPSLMGEFDAAAVLTAIETGMIPPGDQAHQDAVKLLESACKKVIEKG